MSAEQEMTEATPALAEEADKRLRVPLRRSKMLHLLIDGRSLDQPVVICVDTGAAGCVIASESSAKFQITAITAQKQLGGLGSAEVPADTGVCHDLELGNGILVPQMKVMIASLGHVQAYLKKLGEEPYDMILGCDFLIGHQAVLDCAKGELLLHPEYQEPPEVSALDALSALPAEAAAEEVAEATTNAA